MSSFYQLSKFLAWVWLLTCVILDSIVSHSTTIFLGVHIQPSLKAEWWELVLACKEGSLSWFSFQMPSSIPSCLESLGCSKTSHEKMTMRSTNLLLLSIYVFSMKGLAHSHGERVLTPSVPHTGYREWSVDFRGSSFLRPGAVRGSLTFFQGCFCSRPLLLWQELIAFFVNSKQYLLSYLTISISNITWLGTLSMVNLKVWVS